MDQLPITNFHTIFPSCTYYYPEAETNRSTIIHFLIMLLLATEKVQELNV